jgi:hypothetical protein
MKGQMKPFGNDIKLKFSLVEKNSSSLAEEIFCKSKTLLSYENNALIFYENKIYEMHFSGDSLLIFGNDLNGYFFAKKSTKEIGYLYKEENGEWTTKICNTNTNNFIIFNDIFICMVHKRINNGIDGFEKIISAIETFFIEIDALAMKEEEYFWPTRIF